jgi:hypothetical protein
LGKDFTQVHAYLDQFDLIYGMSHRQLFHHQAGIDLIVRKFGKEARAAAEIHIIENLLPNAPIEKWQELRDMIPKSWWIMVNQRKSFASPHSGRSHGPFFNGHNGNLYEGPGRRKAKDGFTSLERIKMVYLILH